MGSWRFDRKGWKRGRGRWQNVFFFGWIVIYIDVDIIIILSLLIVPSAISIYYNGKECFLLLFIHVLNLLLPTTKVRNVLIFNAFLEKSRLAARIMFCVFDQPKYVIPLLNQIFTQPFCLSNRVDVELNISRWIIPVHDFHTNSLIGEIPQGWRLLIPADSNLRLVIYLGKKKRRKYYN